MELKQIEENLSKQQDDVKKTGKDMMKVRVKRNWEYLDDTGTSAWYKWDEKYGGELAVLAGKAKFSIKVKVSEDPKRESWNSREISRKGIREMSLRYQRIFI